MDFMVLFQENVHKLVQLEIGILFLVLVLLMNVSQTMEDVI